MLFFLRVGNVSGSRWNNFTRDKLEQLRRSLLKVNYFFFCLSLLSLRVNFDGKESWDGKLWLKMCQKHRQEIFLYWIFKTSVRHDAYLLFLCVRSISAKWSNVATYDFINLVFLYNFHLDTSLNFKLTFSLAELTSALTVWMCLGKLNFLSCGKIPLSHVNVESLNI